MFPADTHASLWIVPSGEPLLRDLIEAATGGADLLDRASFPDQAAPPQSDAGTAPKEPDRPNAEAGLVAGFREMIAKRRRRRIPFAAIGAVAVVLVFMLGFVGAVACLPCGRQ
jgi:hypothetical protein